MTKKMLIDAAHAEEVRVCVLENGKVEDFDFESSTRKPLRGNIYLARVTRVEPSLQAAFVEYGGNRHGFLAFNEIHPDYYQIPVSDRRILQEAEAEEARLAAELELEQRGDDEGLDLDSESDDDEGGPSEDLGEFEAEADAEASSETGDDETGREESTGAAGDEPSDKDKPAALEANEAATASAEPNDGDQVDDAQDASNNGSDDDLEANNEEDTGAEQSQEANAGERQNKRGRRNEILEQYKEARRKRARLVRNYKIQEVIKRRQILLIQVVKEERGNKGAALTTYMSLAGRYCVLMPNTARGGGISRKIPVATDRKRLRRVVDSLDVPQGMGLIIRTAGAKRTKAEIKRDYDYLIRLWENIRALTLKSIAPCLIYEEASLIKRAIRDLYDKDISDVLVEGDAGYREAKDFMKMLMPSHAKNVQPYKEKTPLLLKYDVEGQLDSMYQPTVRLKSGGYLVIHQTEALIAIDVNSGKSTRERNIELTALKTNLEAAKETARQCRLRDLAGLIVIDFIDMEENKNNRTVEKRLREAMKNDRARIQIGRISNFGLMEMSRQRRRSGIVDGTTNACPTCNGAGVIRSNEMAALRILRAVESEALASRSAVISVRASLDVTLYILNQKREWLKRIEDDYALSVEIIADSAKSGDQYDVEKRGAPRELPASTQIIRADQPEISVDETAGSEDAVTDEIEASSTDDSDSNVEDGARKRRRRRRKRRDDAGGADAAAAQAADDTRSDSEETREASVSADESEAPPKKRRRRGRRGGRRNNRRESSNTPETAPANSDQPTYESQTEAQVENAAPQSNHDSGERDTADEQPVDIRPAEVAENSEDMLVNGRGVTAQAEPATPDDTPPADQDREESEPAGNVPRKSKSSKKGWWQRAIGG